MPSHSLRLLPQDGEEVVIDGLTKAKQYNGKTGTIVDLAREQGRYGVDVKGHKKVLAVKLANLRIKRSPKKSKLHVLVPCHINTERRLVTFQRSTRSILMQVYDNYSVFVGLSGPEAFREEALAFLAVTGFKSSARWYVQDDSGERRSQMEHLYSLLTEGSIPANTDAMLTFVDNDDMCHPARFNSLMDAYRGFPLKGYPLEIPCKLLLDPSLTPAESVLENFVNVQNFMDFHHWKKKPSVTRKVQLVSNSQAKSFDAEEYFDFIVPSAILTKFFELNPAKVREHRFCDLRLWKILSHIAPIELEDVPDLWLIAHYKVSKREKNTTFDNHGKRNYDQNIHSVDQTSFTPEPVIYDDRKLSEAYQSISAPQVAMCRGHLESIILQYCGWDDNQLEDAKNDKVGELNRLYGNGFGDALWRQCHDSILSLFDGATLAASKGAWKTPQTDLM